MAGFIMPGVHELNISRHNRHASQRGGKIADEFVTLLLRRDFGWLEDNQVSSSDSGFDEDEELRSRYERKQKIEVCKASWVTFLRAKRQIYV